MVLYFLMLLFNQHVIIFYVSGEKKVGMKMLEILL